MPKDEPSRPYAKPNGIVGWGAVIVVTIATAAPPLYAFWLIFDLKKGVVASIYLGVCIGWYLFVQTRLKCANCYYFGKVCKRGLGRVAALLYRWDSGNDLWGRRLEKLFWPWWYFGVPIAAMAYLLLSRHTLVVGIQIFVYGLLSLGAWAVDRWVVSSQCWQNDVYKTGGVTAGS